MVLFFFVVALLFKLGSFPFHQWLCDVYEGSSLNVTTFFATAPKIILLAFFIKILNVFFTDKSNVVTSITALSAICSICFASVAALFQKRIKRLITYSTVAHTGFLIIAVSCLSFDAIKASIIYIMLYVLMTLTLFSLLTATATVNDQQKYLIN